MLRPQDGPTRERKALDGLWAFKLDGDRQGRAERWWRSPLNTSLEMPVPCSYNDVLADTRIRNHVGDVWYQTDFWVPPSWSGRRTLIQFGSATHQASVWVGETLVAEHEGGYLPFEADITQLALAGSHQRLTVLVNNELSYTTIPPGIIVDTPHGPRQRFFHDFFNYAGLHRSIWLHTTPTARITDLTVTTNIDGRAGLVDYEATVAGGSESLRVVATLRDRFGNEAATAEGHAAQLRVPVAELWAPGQGNLYDLEVQLFRESQLVDQYVQSVGIRTVEVDGARFLINGQPFRFLGAGKHEDGAVRGRAHDDTAMVHDFALLEWLGANSFRTSHYPYAEEVLDYADRHGIVVIDESPAVGLNLSWPQLTGFDKPLATFSPETISDTTRERHLDAIRELIQRDRNHPSVVMWVLANEPDSASPDARSYFEPLVAETRRLDPTRPIGFTNMLTPPDRCQLAELFDVVMLNRYYGWYFQSGNLRAAEDALRAEVAQWQHIGRPIIFTEFGADAIAGLHSVFDDVLWTEEYQRAMLKMYLRVFDDTTEVVGEHVWAFADFATPSGIRRVDGNKKGIFTRDRQPKAAAHLLRERWHRMSAQGFPLDAG